MDDITWQDPPPRKPGKDWAAVLEHLRKRPGRWALIDHGYASIVSYIQRRHDPRGEFEFTTRAADDGKRDIYGRYIGGER